MRYLRGAAVALAAVASVALLPMSEASARCWWNGANWQCGPGLLALPFVVAGTAVAGAAAIVTAPVRAVTGAPYYGPGYAPGYYAPPPAGYYYRQPPVNQSNN